MSLAEIDEHLRGGLPLPDRAVHISFDDGFANTLVAAEVLEHHRVPWTLFVIVDALLDGYRPWFVRVANAVGASEYVQRPDGSVAELGTSASKWRFARELKARIMAAPAARHEEIVEALLRLPGFQVPAQDCWTLLGVNDVLELHARGVEIGNHSARHVNLNRCDARALHAEVETSRRRLEAALGAPVRWFSYPDGRYDRRALRAAAIGHDLATSVWRPGARFRPLAIPRYGGGVDRLEASAGGTCRRPYLREMGSRRSAGKDT